MSVPQQKPSSSLGSICIVTCYRRPDDVRAVTLRQGVIDSALFDDVIIIKNTHTDIRRYIEVLGSLIRVRFGKNPATYLITFRGYELLPLLLLLAGSKRIIYDEFINPIEWFAYEHTVFAPSSLPIKLMRGLFRRWMKHSTAVLTDTASHAEYSASLMDLKRDLFTPLPVGADETIFIPSITKPDKDQFRVLYYGSMLPLHGVDYVLEAAVKLQAHTDIEFHLIGGKQAMATKVARAVAQGAHIHYDEWVEYSKLPQLIASSSLCLGGPFGNTVQSQYVVTGKTYQFLAAGRAAVVGDNQETRLFSDRKNALIVKQADTAALVKTIEWGYNNQAALLKIGTAGRALYEAQFSRTRIAHDLGVLFTSDKFFKVKATRNNKQNS